jgi:hypothetical protein
MNQLIPDFQQRVQETITKLGLTGNEPYMRIKNVAEEVGLRTEYDVANTILSKFVHATSLSIFTAREPLEYLIPVITIGACDYCNQILDDIQTHLRTSGLPSY